MASIELGSLSQFLEDAEIKDLAKALKKVGVTDLPKSDDAGGKIGDEMDDDVFADFVDRLDAEDVAADLYLPIEFEGVVKVGTLRVGSAAMLLEVLEEIKDDLDVALDDDEEDDDDDDSEEDEEDEDGLEAEDDDDDDEALRLKERLLKQCWKFMHGGATASMDRTVPLFVKS
jgi:hypothetical protein